MGRTKAQKVVKVPCSQAGIREAINHLHRYESYIYRLNGEFVRRLAEEGFDIASIAIQSSTNYDRDKPVGTLDILTDSTGAVSSCRLKFSGEQVMFIEFGAGFYYNTNSDINNWAEQFGYGVGTYPNQVHANDESGWSYQADTGEWIHTMGTEATAPLFNAIQAIITKNRFAEIAREVYRSAF